MSTVTRHVGFLTSAHTVPAPRQGGNRLTKHASISMVGLPHSKSYFVFFPSSVAITSLHFLLPSIPCFPVSPTVCAQLPFCYLRTILSVASTNSQHGLASALGTARRAGDRARESDKVVGLAHHEHLVAGEFSVSLNVTVHVKQDSISENKRKECEFVLS